MRCRKVRQLIPLAAGGDLRPRQAMAVRAHIDACAGCRADLEDFRTAFAGIKAAAKAESVAAWNEGEWKAAVARAVAAAPEPKPQSGRSVGLAWAAASVLGIVLGLIVMGVLFRGPSPRPDTAAGTGGPLLAAGTGEQDRLTMTLVSPETGLQIVWTLDKNFEWKGDRP
jgi:anti-sigma factor RsiW